MVHTMCEATLGRWTVDDKTSAIRMHVRNDSVSLVCHGSVHKTGEATPGRWTDDDKRNAFFPCTCAKRQRVAGVYW